MEYSSKSVEKLSEVLLPYFYLRICIIFYPNKKSDTIIYTNYVGQFSTLKYVFPSVKVSGQLNASRNSILKIIL